MKIKKRKQLYSDIWIDSMMDFEVHLPGKDLYDDNFSKFFSPEFQVSTMKAILEEIQEIDYGH